MTRAAFLEGFTERLRNVLQKHEREARTAVLAAKYGGISPERSLAISTDAAIDELARYLCDAFDRPV